MADEKSGEHSKTIEMRLAAIEDKLAKMHVTEEEMKAYHKVASIMGAQDPSMGGTQAAGSTALSPQICVARSRFVCILPRWFCYECYCGPCIQQGGGGVGGGGFGGFGM